MRALTAAFVLLSAHAASAACIVPSAHDRPPSGHPAKETFHLRADYPAALPTKEAYPWEQFDFRTDWQGYLRAVLAYAREGNDDPSVDWYVERNARRAWYHAPWMHWGDSGREYIHGLTRERSPAARDLRPQTVRGLQAWAVGAYNDRGGYTLGQVWRKLCDPDATKALFEEGTVSFKLLFTDATVAQIPWLDRTLEWQAHINPAGGGTTRTVRTVRLIQVDVGIRDSRAAETGWVFGTFVYRGDAPGATIWDRLVPASLQWGNDPTVVPGGPIQESRINADLNGKSFGWPERPFLGWHGRANGPIDNQVSSCLSCHGSAQFPRSVAYGNLYQANMNLTDTQRVAVYFRNIRPGQLFDANTPRAVPLDYSLQLQAGFERLCRSYTNGELAGEPEPAVCSHARAVADQLPPGVRAATQALTVRGANQPQ